MKFTKPEGLECVTIPIRECSIEKCDTAEGGHVIICHEWTAKVAEGTYEECVKFMRFQGGFTTCNLHDRGCVCGTDGICVVCGKHAPLDDDFDTVDADNECMERLLEEDVLAQRHYDMHEDFDV